jgi:hypothetical protein
VVCSRIINKVWKGRSKNICLSDGMMLRQRYGPINLGLFKDCHSFIHNFGAVVIVGFTTTNYLCNQCLIPLMLWVRISIRESCTTLCCKVCQWLVTGQWFSPGPPVSSTNKTDRHDIAEILLKVALNTIKQKTFIIVPRLLWNN